MSEGGERGERGFETRAVHAGHEPDPVTGAVVPPISLSTTFAQERVGRHRGWEYARTANPTRAALEACIASLEGARYGLAFASGMAAEDAVLRQLPAGRGIVLGGDAYGGTFRLIDKVYGASGHPWVARDLTDPAGLDRHWPDGTGLVWAETP
ncbi:MAG TPA: PLP-dependent transferase, partial [Acidimicrobiales bacterium]|nr:PLP-dependent transferase [Acidimicrobiales bacterium]